MTTKTIMSASVVLVLPAALWMAGYAFGFGQSFNKPEVPQGAHLQGPAGKGTITYTVNPSLTPMATIQFEGRCGNTGNVINTGPIDVTPVTNVAMFPTATEKEVADSLEGYFTSNSAAVAAFQSCYSHTAFGLYITAVNRSLTKTATLWVGEVTIQGVRF